jgi:hypothetical protein
VYDKRVRELLRTKSDLHAFLRSYAARVVGETTGGESARDRTRLKALLAELNALPAVPAGEGESADPQRQRLEQELQGFMRKYHAQDRASGVTMIVSTQYTGGISLAPRLFSVKKSSTRPALEKLKAASRTAGTNWSAAGWIRSGEPPAAAGSAARAPAAPTRSTRSERPAAGRTKPQPPSPDESPEEAAAPALPPATPALSSIAVPGSATPAGSPLVGRLGDGRRIVFTRTAR